MRVNLRFAELLSEYHDRGRGCIKRICNETGLERHQVAAVLRNSGKYISPEVLAAIASYMWKIHQVEPERLLGSLFRVEADKFSTLVAGRPYLEICLGMRAERVRRTETAEAFAEGSEAERQGQPRRGLRWQWVMAADAFLHAALLHEIFGLQRANHAADPGSSPHTQPRRMEQRLVREYDVHRSINQMRAEAESAYQDFERTEGGKGLICVGSVKSNILIEVVISNWFSAEPFRSQDSVGRAGDRSCPFFLRIRDEDPSLQSSHVGMHLTASQESRLPGIYYERTPGDWGFCPYDETHDVAMVFYHYRVPEGRLEVVLGGYSGRASYYLATKLGKLVGAFSQPVYRRDDLQIGVFLVPFQFRRPKKGTDDERENLALVEPNPKDVICIPARAIARRLEKRP